MNKTLLSHQIHVNYLIPTLLQSQRCCVITPPFSIQSFAKKNTK